MTEHMADIVEQLRECVRRRRNPTVTQINGAADEIEALRRIIAGKDDIENVLHRELRRCKP